ncbi:hypothetical protein ABVK25_004880 [Lepraria finkii]|uniref:Uncharacterized protein n=1 Tax=Lepraria finkii TaxID=1340010 RepID=A0ABR4BGK3_9LECA
MPSHQMLYKALIFNAVLLFFGFVLHATASPLAEASLQSRTLGKRYEGAPSGKLGDGGPDTSDYQSDSDIAAAYVAPNGAFVFFSGILDSQAPYQFSQTLSPPGSILRGAFTKGFVTRGKPQRSLQWFQDFWTARPDILLTRLLRLAPYPVPGGILGRRDADSSLVKRDNQYCADWQGDQEDPADPDSTPGVGLGYYPGNCGVHVVQYQKNEGAPDSTGGTSNYRFDILIKDDQGELVGELDYADAPGGQGVDVDSALPEVLIVTAQNVDSDPVQFAYAGQSWDSNSGQCSVGGYDSGSRQIDCGFTC